MKPVYDEFIERAAQMYLPGVDWRLYKAQLWQESSLRPDAVSPAGARGIAQFMPKTWDRWGGGLDIHDPKASIEAGARYMAWLIDQWRWPRPPMDRHCLAMASYNAGLGNILKAQKLSGDKSLYKQIIFPLVQITGPTNAHETRSYVQKILSIYNQEITG
jgi:soluble lytic murein transglycosylase-like protein